MSDLFSFHYPEIAGSKGGGASLDAALKVTATGRKSRLECLVIELFESQARWTPDEAAARLGLHAADIRPRFSELCVNRTNRKGEVTRPAYLRKTKERRKSGRGNDQHVYERIEIGQ